MKLVPRFVTGQQMQTVGEDLPALDKARRANDDRLRLAPIENGTGAYRNLGVRLPNLVAALAEKRALLIRDFILPVNTRRVGGFAEQLDNFAHRRPSHLSCESSR
jgi:hypothetical protein